MGENPAWESVFRAKGMIPKEKPDDKPARLVPASFAVINGVLTWVLPIETASEANGRDWRKRSARTKQARDVVSKAFGPVPLDDYRRWYHEERKPLRLTFTRLATRKLDEFNLGPALKATEDAVALMFGANDGDPRWMATAKQEVGKLVGVRVEIVRWVI